MAKVAKSKKRKTVEVGSLERFTIAKIHRRRIINAPYNPRVITEDERDRLAAIIERHGLVAPITWNIQTGNIVGGHQRVSLCDDFYGTDDYEMTVSQIDVDLDREKELNLALNNGAAQGSYDLEKLEAMFRDSPKLEISGTGFDGHELFQLFGSSPFENRADDALSEVATKVREARERQEATRSKVKAREEAEFYLVVVFKSETERDAYCDAVGWEHNRYQSGDHLRLISREWIAEQAARRPSAGEPSEPSEPPGLPQDDETPPDPGEGGGAAADAPGEP